MMRRTLLTTAAFCGLCATANAAPETHDGFFLQFNIGPSGQDWTIANPPFGLGVIDEMSVSGSGVQFDLSIGRALTTDLILFGQISTNTVLAPTITLRGGNLSAAETTDEDVSASTIGLGVGVQYYVMPAGVYVAGSVLAVQLQIAQDEDGDGVQDDRRGSERGIGVQLRVGKEWWVSDEWGLGVAGSYLRASIPEEGGTDDWAVNNFALTFTATYN